MKRMIDDGMLDTAAKSFIKHYEGENAPADAPSSENSYFTSIKVAKAKAGARRSINRTVRICAVAAVLMIGLVCALLMGSENDDKPIIISYTKDAYMFKNFDPDSEWNMPVRVTVMLKENKDKEKKDNFVYLCGSVVVKDLNGNTVIENLYVNISYKKDKGVGYENKIIPENYPIDFEKLSLETYFFNADWSEFVVEYYEKPSVIYKENSVWDYDTEDAIYIVSGATNREEAVKKVENTVLYDDSIE